MFIVVKDLSYAVKGGRLPQWVKKIADIYGSQAVVLSVQAKKNDKNSWDVYIDSARENTKIDVLDSIDLAPDVYDPHNTVSCGQRSIFARSALTFGSAKLD